MNRTLLPLVLAGLGFLCGCESTPSQVSSAIQRRFTPEYRTHDVKTDERSAYDAVKLCLSDMGFSQTRGGPSQGFIEAQGQVIPAGPTSVARQTTVKVKIGVSTREPGAVEISALFSSVEDSPLRGQRDMATEVPLGPDDTHYYEILFSRVDGRLTKSP